MGGKTLDTYKNIGGAQQNCKSEADLPLKIITHNLGVVQGFERGEAHCTSDKHANADEWKADMSGAQKN